MDLGEKMARLELAAKGAECSALKEQRDELLAAMRRYLPLIERAESDPAFWVPLSAGLGLATANYYRAAIAKAEGGQP